jgi:hypothetical protein
VKKRNTGRNGISKSTQAVSADAGTAAAATKAPEKDNDFGDNVRGFLTQRNGCELEDYRVLVGTEIDEVVLALPPHDPQTFLLIFRENHCKLTPASSLKTSFEQRFDLRVATLRRVSAFKSVEAQFLKVVERNFRTMDFRQIFVLGDVTAVSPAQL